MSLSFFLHVSAHLHYVNETAIKNRREDELQEKSAKRFATFDNTAYVPFVYSIGMECVEVLQAL